MQKKKPNSQKNQQPHRISNRRQMLWVAGVAVVLFVTVFFSIQKKPSSYTPEVMGVPGLKVNTEKVDLGNVKLGDTVEVSFEIKNIGSKPLRFTDVPYVEVKEGC